MAILKNKTNAGIAKTLSFSHLQVDASMNMESVSNFDKEEYLQIIEEAKTNGFKEGYTNGYDTGYNEGLSVYNEDKIALYYSLEKDKSNTAKYMETLSYEYINTFKNDMLSLISNSIDKIFLKAISNEMILHAYFENLIDFIYEKYKSFTIVLNSKTFKSLESFITDKNISYEIDETISDWDFLVKTTEENIEFFLKEEQEKIKELFK